MTIPAPAHIPANQSKHAPLADHVPLRVPLLSPEECAEVVSAVYEARELWFHRHEILPTYTLGASAYLDAPGSHRSRYLIRARKGNRWLRPNLAWLHERILAGLSEALKVQVFLTPRHGLPGIHVFEHHPRIASLNPMPHWDLPDVVLPDFDGERLPAGNRFSFTLALQVPEGGAGVNFWDEILDIEKHHDLPEAYRNDPPQAHLIEYRLGEMVIHSGERLHQIASHLAPGPGEARVTLQGHGRPTDQGWEVFW